MQQKVSGGSTERRTLPVATGLIALLSVVAVLVGVTGQLVTNGSVAFGMVSGFGLAILAGIVIAHEPQM